MLQSGPSKELPFLSNQQNAITCCTVFATIYRRSQIITLPFANRNAAVPVIYVRLSS